MNEYIYNFTTNQYDVVSEPITDWTKYVGQSPAAVNLYKLYVEMGDKPAEAARKVLEAQVGVSK